MTDTSSNDDTAPTADAPEAPQTPGETPAAVLDDGAAAQSRAIEGPEADAGAETDAPADSEPADGDEASAPERPRRKRRGADTAGESMRVLESLLFASGELLTPAKLKSIVPGEPDARKLRTMVDTINGELQSQRHPFHIVEAAGGYQFRTVPYYSPWVRQLLKEKATKRLSIQALECLAIIAYRQPITRAEIESIRGTLSDGAMKTLLERRMVTVAGRSEKAGRPLLYGTTKDFLSYFGLRTIEEMPNIEEFEALAKEKMGDVAQELEQMQKARHGAGEQPAPEEDLPQIERDDGSVPRQAAEDIDQGDEGLNDTDDAAAPQPAQPDEDAGMDDDAPPSTDAAEETAEPPAGGEDEPRAGA